jgi:hypothetical protein
VRIQPVFEMNLVHSGWRNCFVSCAVVVGVQQCADNVLYPLAHRTLQSHIYRTDADMFGNSRFAVRRIVEEGLPSFAFWTRYDKVPLEGLTSR